VRRVVGTTLACPAKGGGGRLYMKGNFYVGYHVYRFNSFFGAYYLGFHCFVFKSVRGNIMLVIYWIGGITAFLLFVYLLIALLKPEIF